MAASVFLIGGCWNGRLLIAMEEPYWVSKGGNAQLRLPLARASLRHGYLPRIVLVGAQENAEGKLRHELTIRHYRAAIVGPLLSIEPQAYASASPATEFLLVEDPVAVSQGKEARLVFDRAPAFKTAGYAAGLAIRDDAGGVASNSLASRIGVLASAHTPGTQEELGAFSEGVAQALDGGQPSVRSLADPVDQNTVKSAVEQMRRTGVEIFLLFLGAPDSWALEDMKNSGGSAIVSDWEFSQAFPGQVFLSIETDLMGGVTRFLASEGHGKEVVSGPVRLVAGKARPLPSEIRSQVAVR